MLANKQSIEEASNDLNYFPRGVWSLASSWLLMKECIWIPVVLLQPLNSPTPFPRLATSIMGSRTSESISFYSLLTPSDLQTILQSYWHSLSLKAMGHDLVHFMKRWHHSHSVRVDVFCVQLDLVQAAKLLDLSAKWANFGMFHRNSTAEVCGQYTSDLNPCVLTVSLLDRDCLLDFWLLACPRDWIRLLTQKVVASWARWCFLNSTDQKLLKLLIDVSCAACHDSGLMALPPSLCQIHTVYFTCWSDWWSQNTQNTVSKIFYIGYIGCDTLRYRRLFWMQVENMLRVITSRPSKHLKVYVHSILKMHKCPSAIRDLRPKWLSVQKNLPLS